MDAANATGDNVDYNGFLEDKVSKARKRWFTSEAWDVRREFHANPCSHKNFSNREPQVAMYTSTVPVPSSPHPPFRPPPSYPSCSAFLCWWHRPCPFAPSSGLPEWLCSDWIPLLPSRHRATWSNHLPSAQGDMYTIHKSNPSKEMISWLIEGRKAVRNGTQESCCKSTTILFNRYAGEGGRGNQRFSFGGGALASTTRKLRARRGQGIKRS